MGGASGRDGADGDEEDERGQEEADGVAGALQRTERIDLPLGAVDEEIIYEAETLAGLAMRP